MSTVSEKAKRAILLLSVEIAALRSGRVTEQLITTNVTNTVSSLPALPADLSELAKIAPNLSAHVSFIDLEATRSQASAALQTVWASASASALAAAAAASAAATAAGSQAIAAVAASKQHATEHETNSAAAISVNKRYGSDEEGLSVGGGGGVDGGRAINENKMIVPDSATRHPLSTSNTGVSTPKPSATKFPNSKPVELPPSSSLSRSGVSASESRASSSTSQSSSFASASIVRESLHSSSTSMEVTREGGVPATPTSMTLAANNTIMSESIDALPVSSPAMGDTISQSSSSRTNSHMGVSMSASSSSSSSSFSSSSSALAPLDETGSNSSTALIEKAMKEWTSSKILELLETLSKHKTRELFNKPVSEEEAPKYRTIVKEPMDYSTIKKRFDAGLVGNLDEFARLVDLIISNCKAYNPADEEHSYFSWAVSLDEFWKPLLRKSQDALKRERDRLTTRMIAATSGSAVSSSASATAAAVAAVIAEPVKTKRASSGGAVNALPRSSIGGKAVEEEKAVAAATSSKRRRVEEK
jgi:hypothetical protein